MASVIVVSASMAALLLTGLVLILRGVVRFPDPPGMAQFIEANAGRPDADLLARVGALEARLARLEAERSAPAHPSPSSERRADRAEPWPPGRRPTRRDDGPVLIAVPDLASTGVRNSAEAFAEFDRRFGDVWTLADDGLSDDEIAARTGYPAGQVELILGLRRPTGSTAAPRFATESSPLDPKINPPHPSRGDEPHA